MKLPNLEGLSYKQHALLGSTAGFLTYTGTYAYAAMTVPELKNYPLDRAATELAMCTILTVPAFVGLEYFSRMLDKVGKRLHKSLSK